MVWQVVVPGKHTVTRGKGLVDGEETLRRRACVNHNGLHIIRLLHRIDGNCG